MSFERPITTAKLITSDELEQSLSCLSTAETQAQQIIAAAEAEAKERLDAVREQEERLNQKLHNLSDEEMQKFIDEEGLLRSIEAFVQIMNDAAKIRQDFEALTPWLTKLVETSVRKIMGTLDESELVARVVAEGVADMDARDTLGLRVSPKDRKRLTAAKKSHPDHFQAIRTIVSDATLEDGTILLEGDGGFSDVSIETQIDALCDYLDNAIVAQGGEK